jgi:CRISPR-associated protein Csm1
MEIVNDSIAAKGKQLLVKGDFSGIQEFIFNVKSEGAAKTLKAKSFFIKAISQISVTYLFEKFDIPINDREDLTISVSGGNYFILLPLIDTSESVLNEYCTKANHLLSKIGLSIVLSYTIYKADNYPNNLDELNEHSLTTKYKLLNNLPFEELFTPFQDNNSLKWAGFGTSLRNAKSFKIVPFNEVCKEAHEEESLRVTDHSIIFLSYQLMLSNEITKVDKFSLENKLDTCFPFNSRTNVVLKFEEIAGKAGSTTKLGILKIDVDNLGTIFQLTDNVQNHKKMSESFRNFFENSLYELIYHNTDYQNSVYSIISGGDECFLVGDWYKIINLAFEINSNFRSFVLNTEILRNSNVTISAGIIIIHSKFPVVRFAEMAENALHQAKTIPHWVQVTANGVNSYCSKDSVTLFNTTIKWDDWQNVKIIKDKLESFIANNPRSLLMNARKAVLNNSDPGKVKLSDFWKLAYHLREVNKKGNFHLLNDILNLYERYLLESIEKDDNRYHFFFPIAARLVELQTRN